MGCPDMGPPLTSQRASARFFSPVLARTAHTLLQLHIKPRSFFVS